MALVEKRRILRTDPMVWRSLGVDPRDNSIRFQGEQELTVYSTQVTRSEGHEWPKGRGVRDVGGPFETVKCLYNRSPKSWGRMETHQFFEDAFWEGDTIPANFGFPAAYLDPNLDIELYRRAADGGSFAHTDLTALGTKFISQTIPTNPTVDASVSLAELFREGIPSMIGAAFLRDRVGFFRSLGSEYLNFEFGWKPLVNDLKNASRAIIESEEILQRLQTYSGRDLKRERILPLSTTTMTFVGNHNPTSLPSNAWSAPPWYRYSETTTRQQWFSGMYTYHFDLGTLNSVSAIVTQARVLYGLELTPETLWNLAPWSWLVDWFANVGPLLHNVSAFQSDGLVLRYGYCMEEVTTRAIRHNDVKPLSWTNHPVTVRDEFLSQWKRREKATPFGFGLNTAAFTNRQWAILGALGITRAPKML